ncbi:hypothetical protein AAY473_016889 [Plecturocebus cupreus]
MQRAVPAGLPAAACRQGLAMLPRLPNTQTTQFVNGCSSKPSQLVPAKAGYAVVPHSSVIKAATLPSSTTSQQAELISLTHALTVAKGLHVNIYINSKYAFHILYH